MMQDGGCRCNGGCTEKGRCINKVRWVTGLPLLRYPHTTIYDIMKTIENITYAHTDEYSYAGKERL